MDGVVVAVCRSPRHSFSKAPQLMVRLVAGRGVEGDAHAGETVKHRSRVAVDPTQPNLRQVHLVSAETHAELAEKGFAVGPGDMGENVTTHGLDLFALPRGARLRLGAEAMVEITGLRNPCGQLNSLSPDLLEATLRRDASGETAMRAGVMSVVVEGGSVRPGDAIAVTLPAEPHLALRRV